MLNEFNIKIFDYIYSVNIGLKGDYLENNNIDYLCSQLSEKINKSCDEYDFWEEYKYYFNDKCVIDASTFDGKQYIYNGFPKLKLSTKKEYFNYKIKQIKNSISNSGDFSKEEFEKITEDIINVGRKEILDYCVQIGLIEYIGKVFISADNSPACAIIYDNIRPVIYTEEEVELLSANNIIIVNGDRNTFGTIEQNNNSKNDDNKLFETVLNKLDLLQKEGVTKEQIKSIEDACKEKNKTKVVGFLKDVASGTISSLISTGILYKFGIS